MLFPMNFAQVNTQAQGQNPSFQSVFSQLVPESSIYQAVSSSY